MVDVDAPVLQDTGGVEYVVLLNDAGEAIGTADKTQCHHGQTPLHLAFSCYLFDADDRLLITRRALTKSVFPGVWTNSVCGHPGPGEDLAHAVHRRIAAELGTVGSDLRVVLPTFAYRAEMDGIVEWEMCPVLVGRVDHQGPFMPAPAEVDSTAWVRWDAFASDVTTSAFEVSPWCALQVAALRELGPEPQSWPSGDPALLPPALRGLAQ